MAVTFMWSCPLNQCSNNSPAKKPRGAFLLDCDLKAVMIWGLVSGLAQGWVSCLVAGFGLVLVAKFPGNFVPPLPKISKKGLCLDLGALALEGCSYQRNVKYYAEGLGAEFGPPAPDLGLSGALVR